MIPIFECLCTPRKDFLCWVRAVELLDVGASCAVDRHSLRSKEVVMQVKLLLKRGIGGGTGPNSRGDWREWLECRWE